MKSAKGAFETPANKRAFQQKLLRWYDRHKRDLPWRKNRDPYRVWLSEIMLQQTRVTAVIEYYHRFLERFPTIDDLAAAREASVLAAWSGLGYYRRARMLYATAKKVVQEQQGKFPVTADALRNLPGVGRYTAAAIASIAYDEPVAVVDGNVERVLQRVTGKHLSGEKFWGTANSLLNKKRPGDFNQAMMELGATVCTPKAPTCLKCPVIQLCVTQGEIEQTTKPKPQRKHKIGYTLAHRSDSIFLVKRPADASLMPGMWELPEVQSKPGTNGTCLTLRHSITVTDYTVRVAEGPAPKLASGKWVAKSRLTTMPLTGLTRKILRAAEVM